MELSVIVCLHMLQRHSLPNQVFASQVSAFICSGTDFICSGTKLQKLASEVSAFICSGTEFQI